MAHRLAEAGDEVEAEALAHRVGRRVLEAEARAHCHAGLQPVEYLQRIALLALTPHDPCTARRRDLEDAGLALQRSGPLTLRDDVPLVALGLHRHGDVAMRPGV